MIYSKLYGEKIEVSNKDLNLSNGCNFNNWNSDLLLHREYLGGYSGNTNLQLYCMAFLLFP